MSSESDHDLRSALDPTFLHARREAWFVVGLWLACLLWAIPYCYFTGYVTADFNPDALKTVWGIPQWAFYGIAMPWLVADVVTAWFCFRFMKYDDLGAAHEGADLNEDLAEQSDPPRHA